MWYNIKFTDDVITVRNLSTTERLYVTIYISESCNTDLKQEVLSKKMVDFSENFKLPLRDGMYHILLQQVTDTDFPEEDFDENVLEFEEMLYPYYNNLLLSLIDDVEDFLCGCGCEDCDDCIPDEKTYSGTLLKAFSYYVLMNKYYSRFYDTVFKCLQCDIADASKCLIINEQVTNSKENSELFKKLVSGLYLSFYYAEYYNNEDKVYVNNKFKINKIFDCIKTTNTNIDCITDQIENNMGNFTVTYEGYVNQPPSEVGDYSTTATNKEEKVLTLGMFTTLTTPAYADPEGDAPQAVRIDTLPTNGAVLKLDGSAVITGQIILATDINANKLKLVGPNVNSVVSCTFNFSVRDTGSMQFSS